MSQKVNKVENQFESFNKTLQTVNKYIRDHEDLKRIYGRKAGQQIIQA